MSILVGLHHTTRYEYDRPVWLGPQAVRLRPAPHCRAPISNYALAVEPAQHSVHWQQDPYANWLARFVFRERAVALSLTVDLEAEIAPHRGDNRGADFGFAVAPLLVIADNGEAEAVAAIDGDDGG